MNRSNSSVWRAWRQTSIKVFVGLNILIIVGFYAATSSFHLGLSHLDEGAASGNADSSNSGRTGELLLIRWYQVEAQWLQGCIQSHRCSV